MKHGTLVVPSERARNVLHELGKQTAIQFEDMNSQTLMRAYKASASPVKCAWCHEPKARCGCQVPADIFSVLLYAEKAENEAAPRWPALCYVVSADHADSDTSSNQSSRGLARAGPPGGSCSATARCTGPTASPLDMKLGLGPHPGVAQIGTAKTHRRAGGERGRMRKKAAQRKVCAEIAEQAKRDLLDRYPDLLQAKDIETKCAHTAGQASQDEVDTDPPLPVQRRL